MAYKLPEKEEFIFEDKFLNAGINTNDPPRNVGPTQATEVLNVRMYEKGGIASAKGKTKVYDAVGDIGAYLTNRGGIYWNDNGTEYAVVAQDNGTETAVFAIRLPDGTITKLLETGTENSLTKDTLVHFTPGENNLYWIVDGEDDIYVWDGVVTNAVTTLTEASGTIPTGMKNIFFWNGSLGVANYDTNVSALIRTAYRDYDWWNTVARNTSGNKGFEMIVEARQDQQITAVVGDVFNTLVILRERSLYALQGSNETTWNAIPVTVTHGCVAGRTAMLGNQSLWYLSDLGVQQTLGAQEKTDANRFDSISSSNITSGVAATFDSYTAAEKTASFAAFYKDTYRLNIGSDVWIFDLLANNKEGAMTKGGLENDLNCYINANSKLYGMGATDGFLYLLEDGEDNAGEDYVKSYTTFDNDLGQSRYIKSINEIRVWGKVDSQYPIKLDYYINGDTTKNGSVDLDFLTTETRATYPADFGDSSSVALNTLTDNTKAWTEDEWIGKYLIDKDYTAHTITDNDATSLTVSGDVTPAAGNYAIGWTEEVFYTDPADVDEDWASFYGTASTTFNRGTRPYLRADSIKLRFYTENKDQPFEIYKYQIKYEVTPHESYNARNI